MTQRKRLLELALSGLKHEIAEIENEFRALSKGVMAGAEGLITGNPKRKRRLSATIRRKISNAAKARWAERKAQAAKNNAVKKTRKASAAVRKAASARMKAYWAARRAKQ